MDNKLFEALIALTQLSYVGLCIATGRLWLTRAPIEYMNATRSSDPSRYWAFVICCAVVGSALAVDAIFNLALID